MALSKTDVCQSSLYHALDSDKKEIRILQIVSTVPLTCTFENIYLLNGLYQPYDAISWRWGDANVRGSVLVNNTLLSVPRNAQEVLEELCLRHRKYRIWIDAVCINQADTEERSRQVQMMSDIYTNARSTFVWLGQDHGSTERAIKSIRAIDDWRQIKHSKTGHINCGVFCQAQVTDAFPMDVDWQAIATYFSAQWFSRFWIIQEVALSRNTDVYCGRYCISWRDLAIAAHYICLNKKCWPATVGALPPGLESAQVIGRIGQGVRADMLLSFGKRFKATDPRDRIFALYGLHGHTKDNEVPRDAFLPDYKKSVIDVFEDVTLAALSHSSELTGILLDAQRLVPPRDVAKPDEMESQDLCPSWLPKYHYIEDLSRGSYRISRASSSEQPESGSLEGPRIDPSAPHGVLRIAGIVQDRIHEVFGPLPDMQSLDRLPHRRDSILQTLHRFWHAALRVNDQAPISEVAGSLRRTLDIGRPSALTESSGVSTQTKQEFRAFIARCWPDIDYAPVESGDDSYAPSEVETDSGKSDSESEFDEDDADADALSEQLEASEESEGHSTTSASSESDDDDSASEDTGVLAHRAWHDIAYFNSNKCLIITEGGCLGSAGPKVRVGDAICRLRDLKVEVALRSEGDVWRLIGDAWRDQIPSTTKLGGSTWSYLDIV